MNIEITPKKTDGLERMIEVRVPVETVREAEDQAARKYATNVRLPGFRPGKAPPAMIKKRFKEQIRQQVVESLVQDAFKEVMDREKFDVASQPHVHDLKFDEGEALSFELHLEVRPTIELARTDGFTLNRSVAPVTDDAIREQIEQLRDNKATLSPIEGRPAPGDQVRVELSTADESGAFPDAREYPLELGAGQAIAGVEELIMELTPGEQVERAVRWPDDFPDEAQRGTSKAVRVRLLDAKRKELPALDDAFAREVGDFDSLEALTTTVRTDLADHATREADAGVRQQLIDQIAEANPFAVPSSWVKQLIDNYMQAYQVPETERETFAAEFRQVAERQVRRDLIIETIAEREGLKSTESEIDDRVGAVAAQRGADPGQVYASLQKAGRLREIEQSITEDKVFAWLMERNTIGS